MLYISCVNVIHCAVCIRLSWELHAQQSLRYIGENKNIHEAVPLVEKKILDCTTHQTLRQVGHSC